MYDTSYYSLTRSESLTADNFETESKVDVCIVGGGISSLSCAQALIDEGLSVTILEKRGIFSGASGLNGGFVLPGYSLGLDHIEKKVGKENSKRLFDLTVDGVETIKRNISSLSIDSAHITKGKIDLFRYEPSEKELLYSEKLVKEYNYKVIPLERSDLRKMLSSQAYCYGFYHEKGAHIHPLNYGIALARYLQEKGVNLIEGEEVKRIKKCQKSYEVISSSGKIIAEQVAICTGGYSSEENKKIHDSIIPITTYAAISEPEDSIPRDHIRTTSALGDNRRASDYYRIVNHNQLLWGGRITAFPTKSREKISQKIRKDILASYPAIKRLEIQTSWSGVMGYSTHKMPYIGRLKQGVWYCTAFGGRGLAAGTAGGKVLADAILEKNDKINLFKAFKLKKNHGLIGKIAVEATYKKYIIQDAIKESKNHNRSFK